VMFSLLQTLKSRIYNKKHENFDIQSCIYNIPNITVYWEVNVHYTINICDNPCVSFSMSNENCDMVNYEMKIKQYGKYSVTKSYRLHILITLISYISSEQCNIKYGSKFKYTYLHTKNSKNSKYQNTQIFCSWNYDITKGKFPSTLHYDTPKQRFQFVT